MALLVRKPTLTLFDIGIQTVNIVLIFLTGSPTEYLEHYVFPTLMPAMERMLEQAKKEKCFEVSV